MGYPMTYKRVMLRSGMAEGGYQDCPRRFPLYGITTVGLEHWSGQELRALHERAIHWTELCAGDLRRLEADSTDEGAICTQIARRTGIDADVVAAVLKEYMEI